MEDQNQHIDYDLAAKYLSGECSDAEKLKFESWLEEDEQNAKAWKYLKTIWAADFDQDFVDVDQGWQNMESRIDFKSENNSGLKTMSVFRIAAAVVALIGIVSLLWTFSGPSLVEVHSGNQMAQLTLPDGSEVWLRPSSVLIYPEKFGTDSREVTLKGGLESDLGGNIGVGYFSVTSDKARPFIVHADVGDVRVVGTKFEVQTGSWDNGLVVDVEEGIVEVSTTPEVTPVRVVAGQTATANAGGDGLTVSENNSVAPFFWKDKTIKFRRTKLTNVCSALKELLQLDVKLGSTELAECELTVTFTNEDPETILEIIAMTLNLELTEKDGAFILSGSGC